MHSILFFNPHTNQRGIQGYVIHKYHPIEKWNSKICISSYARYRDSMGSNFPNHPIGTGLWASGPPGPGTHFLMRSILKRTRVYNKGVIRLQMKRIRMRGLPITSVPSSTRFLAISASDLSKKLEETP